MWVDLFIRYYWDLVVVVGDFHRSSGDEDDEGSDVVDGNPGGAGAAAATAN